MKKIHICVIVFVILGVIRTIFPKLDLIVWLLGAVTLFFLGKYMGELLESSGSSESESPGREA